jgi:hypothetical protein
MRPVRSGDHDGFADRGRQKHRVASARSSRDRVAQVASRRHLTGDEPMLDPQQRGSRLLNGPVGAIEVLFDSPRGSLQGLAVVAHPQPLLGGTAQHKLPLWLARALADGGWWAARPNFRGVGRSAGTHDHGVGETDDLLAL